MRIIWVTNYPTEAVCNFKQMNYRNNLGWIDSAYNSMTAISELEIYVLYPANHLDRNTFLLDSKFIGYNPEISDQEQQELFASVFSEIKPDLIHVWGTEFRHALNIVKSIANTIPCVISIQGLMSNYERHFKSGIPSKYLKAVTIRDFIRGDSITKQHLRYINSARREVELVLSSKYVIGRTTWDYANVKLINPNITYLKCYESLRDPFYLNHWIPSNKEVVSLLYSQSYSPIKGLHFAIEALAILTQKYPGVVMKVVGKDLQRIPKWRLSTYEYYIMKLIDSYQINKNIRFLGNLDANQMTREYLECSVFISGSVVENSSNSIGEAMCLGVPIVASFVGGNIDYLTHGTDSFLYPYDEPILLAEYVSKLIEDASLSASFSTMARNKSLEFYNRDLNRDSLVKIYGKIVGEFQNGNT